jgi:nucleotide-binding universal stress UspA family protein
MGGAGRVIAGVNGSASGLHALRRAAAEARMRHAVLVAVHAWVPAGGDLAERRCPVPELRELWRSAARQRLWDAFDAGLGGLPPDLCVEPVVARGEAQHVLVDVADREDDLLVIGAGRRGAARRLLRRRVCRYCVAHAVCPVLVVPPTGLVQELGHPLRSRRAIHRALSHDVDELIGRQG